jgi:hypothetical protein
LCCASVLQYPRCSWRADAVVSASFSNFFHDPDYKCALGM